MLRRGRSAGSITLVAALTCLLTACSVSSAPRTRPTVPAGVSRPVPSPSGLARNGGPLVSDSVFAPGIPGITSHTCLMVDGSDEQLRIGDFVVNGIRLYLKYWYPTTTDSGVDGMLFFAPMGIDRGRPHLSVTLTSLDAGPSVRRGYTVETLTGSGTGEFFYAVGITAPRPGLYRIRAVSGPDMGCFDLVVARSPAAARRAPGSP